MSSPEQIAACRKAISEWRDLTQLPQFAIRRYGYCNSNNATGVTYPGDLDEYQIEVRAISVPAGWVNVFVFQGPILSDMGYEILVPEHVYLLALADALNEAARLSDKVERNQPVVNVYDHTAPRRQERDSDVARDTNHTRHKEQSIPR
jgi:hypothetical protein